MASIAGNARQREALAKALRARGMKVAPSQTNFLLVEFGDHSSRIEARLVGRGVVLRPMGGYGLGECLRITVGTDAQCKKTNGHYGYGCACMKVVVDRSDGRVLRIASATARPLKAC